MEIWGYEKMRKTMFPCFNLIQTSGVARVTFVFPSGIPQHEIFEVRSNEGINITDGLNPNEIHILTQRGIVQGSRDSVTPETYQQRITFCPNTTTFTSECEGGVTATNPTPQAPFVPAITSAQPPPTAPSAQPTSPPPISRHTSHPGAINPQPSPPPHLPLESAREMVRRRGILGALGDARVLTPFAGLSETSGTSSPTPVNLGGALPQNSPAPVVSPSTVSPSLIVTAPVLPESSGRRTSVSPSIAPLPTHDTSPSTLQPTPEPSNSPSRDISFSNGASDSAGSRSQSVASDQMASTSEDSLGSILGAFFRPIGESLSGMARMLVTLSLAQIQNDGVTQGMQSNPLLASLFANSQQSTPTNPVTALAAMNNELPPVASSANATPSHPNTPQRA